MAAFDFPASPTVGTVYTPAGASASYQWDGEKWQGGLLGASGGGGGASIKVGDTPPADPTENMLWWDSDEGPLRLWYKDPDGTEQWVQVNSVPGLTPAIAPPVTDQTFTLDGLSSIDITVPAWAKGAVIEGSVFMAGGTSYVATQVSFDGTTFQTNYNIGGPFHSTTPSTYSSQPVGAATLMYLSYPKSNLNIPHNFTGTMNLTSSGTGLCALRANWVSYDNTTQISTMSWLGWTANQIPVSGRVQKIRIFNPAASAWANASWVTIRWLGDSSAVPTGNAIPEAPQDGCGYIRVNGVWQKRTQTITLDGLTTCNIDVPPTAKALKADIMAYQGAATTSTLGWRASLDGTNFLQAAADYYYVGFAHYTGSSAYTNIAGATSAFGLLTTSHDTPTIPHHARWYMPMFRPATTLNIWGTTIGKCYFSAGSAGYTDIQMQTVMNSTNMGSNLRFQKIQLMWSAVNTFGPGSYADLEWVY